MEWIDTHCHLTFESLCEDLTSVLERSRTAQVTRWICIGTDLVQSQSSVHLAQETDNMYATVGLHPHDAKDCHSELLQTFRDLIQDPKVVAVGETGLDYHYDFSPRGQQQEAFRAQLRLAAEVNLPVVVHTREAFDDTVAILDEFQGDLKGVVLHCFTGSAAQAEVALDRGYWLSFTGAVTFKNAHGIREAAKVVHLERMMIETDCPYMSPEPMRQQRPNEPSLLVHTADCLARLKQVDLEIFRQSVTRSSEQFFAL